MFACLYSSPASASAAGVPCSSSASSVDSLDMPGAWKSSYDALGSKSSSSTTAWSLSSLSSSTPSATIVLEVATPTSIAPESSIFASAPSFRPVASPEPVSERNISTATSSSSRWQVSSASTISNRHTSIPSHFVVDVLDAPSAAPSPPTSISKPRIYGSRRGTTSRITSSATGVLVAATFDSVITPSAPAAVPEPVSKHGNATSSNSRSHLQSAPYVPPYDGRGSSARRIRSRSHPVADCRFQQPSSTETGPSPSTNSATVALGGATPKYTINASASVSASLSDAPLSFTEPVSVHDNHSISTSRLHSQPTASGLDRDTPVAEAEATTTSRPTSIVKAGIYGGRRGPTSRSTSTQLSSTQLSSTSTDAATAPTPPALAPRAVPREKHMRVQVPSVRRHRATSIKRVGRDMTFGGMIPRGRQSSGLRIIVLVRTGLLADQRAKKLLEEGEKEKKRIEKEEREARERKVMGGMLDMARQAEREERMETMARKVHEVKRRRKGMDMEAVPAKKTKKIQIQGWLAGSETDWVVV
ncbi:hypothetical protein C8F01DRAFT_548263 [Mycena amicta]|nr:hypothetical protein C8F01DRAFT_548263 [Mycena amicta]